MSVNQQQYEQIAAKRAGFFNSSEGKRALMLVLETLGFFRTQAEWLEMARDPQRFTALHLQSLLTLADLGVLVKDNFGPLVEAMSALPMPTCE
jgi:hypothetical protein